MVRRIFETWPGGCSAAAEWTRRSRRHPSAEQVFPPMIAFPVALPTPPTTPGQPGAPAARADGFQELLAAVTGAPAPATAAGPIPAAPPRGEADLAADTPDEDVAAPEDAAAPADAEAAPPSLPFAPPSPPAAQTQAVPPAEPAADDQAAAPAAPRPAAAPT